MRILSMVGGLVVIFTYTLIYFAYPESDSTPYLIIYIVTLALTLYNIALAGIFKKNSNRLFLRTEVALYGIIGFLFLDLTGGIGSPYLFIVYFAIVFAFLNSRISGYLTAGSTVFYLIFISLIENQPISVNNVKIVIPQIVGIGFASVISSYYGGFLKNTLSEKSQMQGMVQKLTADKSKDDAILSCMADGVYAVDEDRKIIIFNKAAEDLTGWKAEDAIGLNCSTVMKLKDDQDLNICEKSCPMLISWSSGESVVKNDMCFINKYKKTIQVSGSYAPIKNLSGNTTGGLCVFRDVTKQKQLERQKDEFISTASHEMRTPLTAMEGYIDLATNPKIAKIDEKAKEYLDKAHSQVLGMSRLMKDLLNISKIEEGKFELSKQSFEIKDLISSVIETLNKMATEKGLKLKFNESNISFAGKKAIGVSTKIMADPDKAREVLNNLTENAIKYTKEGHIEVSVTYDQDFATICVADTGIGISPDDQKHIFQKFYQVADYETREVGGTGLGLYITRSMVEMNGGKIWVESKKGQGSKFFFTIPRSID
ncbi:TPA: hypothetical protein DHW59_00555 [candidate division CPR2 bacterium]|nr:hypothetical protein [candidate division CPR2 bacterium]